MTSSIEADRLLIRKIRAGDESAWSDLIVRYEGRLLAFVESRLSKRDVAEDIVQDAFVGFLNSLPNYDGRRPLESYLFSICAYKLTDHMRREGRRPVIPLSSGSESGTDWDVPGKVRGASSIVRSSERRDLEEKAIRQALKEQIARWRDRNEWIKIKCAELLFVRGWANKDVAAHLEITEQHVANYKFDFIARLRSIIQKQGLPEEVFPELYREEKQ